MFKDLPLLLYARERREIRQRCQEFFRSPAGTSQGSAERIACRGFGKGLGMIRLVSKIRVQDLPTVRLVVEFACRFRGYED